VLHSLLLYLDLKNLITAERLIVYLEMIYEASFHRLNSTPNWEGIEKFRHAASCFERFSNIPSSRKGLYLTRRGEISIRAVDEQADNNEEMREKNDIVVSSMDCAFCYSSFLLGAFMICLESSSKNTNVNIKDQVVCVCENGGGVWDERCMEIQRLFG
jgi:hypothetical protein